MVCEAKALAKDPGKDDKEVKKRHSLTKTVDEGPVCDMALFSCFFSVFFSSVLMVSFVVTVQLWCVLLHSSTGSCM